jgi:hypothetical protein
LLLRKREGGNTIITMGKKKGQDIGRKGRKARDTISRGTKGHLQM